MRKISVKRMPKRVFITPKKITVEKHEIIATGTVVEEKNDETLVGNKDEEAKTHTKKAKKAQKKETDLVQTEEIKEN